MNRNAKSLELKPLSDKDRNNVIEILTDNEVKKTYMIPDFESEEQVESMFQRFKVLSLEDNYFMAGIFLKDELIGWVNEVTRENGKIELGYVIHPRHQNKGYATEMLTAMMEELFKGGFSEIITGAFEENSASIRVMEKCDMQKLDQTDEIEYRGVTHTCVYYSKRKSDSHIM